MPLFVVSVIIENKPGLVDPEGDTVLTDLILKARKTSIRRVRSAKMLKFEIEAKNKQLAKKTIMELCNELRIYNPLVSRVSFDTTVS
jgi:phosphoribosylformylglycinamidine synthase subunit PurS